MLCGRGGGLLRQKSIIHRRGDSFSSLRSDEADDCAEAEPRPIFFMHGVGLGLVRVPSVSVSSLSLKKNVA